MIRALITFVVIRALAQDQLSSPADQRRLPT
jgi:hypothetical protein